MICFVLHLIVEPKYGIIVLMVGKWFVNDYANIALGVLGDDIELSAQIKEKYFSNINSYS